MTSSLVLLAEALRRLMRWGGRGGACLALLSVLALSGSEEALAAVEADPVSLQVAWCAAPPQASIDEMVNAPRPWQDLRPAGISQGFDKRAFWLKLKLQNPSSQSLERWLELGHPQLAEVSLFLPKAYGWERYETGVRVPLDQRGSVESDYGVVPVTLPAGAVQTAWVRIASDTGIILRAKAWEPDEFRASVQKRHFWAGLGIGALVLAVLFSISMMVFNRQAAYGYFALGLVGQLVATSMASGVFQRFLWPEDWILTSTVRDLAALLGLIGFYRFLLSFLPQVRRYVFLWAILRAAFYICAAVLIARLIGQRGVDPAWFVTVIVAGVTALLICAKAWREGDRAAGIMMVPFGAFVASAVIRFLVVNGFIDFVPEITNIPFFSIFFLAPLVLLGLVARTRQLQEELTRVQAENAAQLRFLAHMSHELRSPLDNVLGNAQLLAREARSPSQITGINSIFDSGRQLLRIIDHILDYARGSAGMLKMEPSPLHLGTFLRGIERMAKLISVRRDNRFELKLHSSELSPRSLRVMVDGERLRQVLGNLLGNAGRHTSDGSIKLHVRAVSVSDERVRLEFSVDDTGEGISEHEQARIFRPFERAESSAQYAGKGAGLGLAIARQMVELMGGHLTVRSALGQGASFSFGITVPLLSAQAQSAPERLDGFDAAGYLGPRRHVLVVDDEFTSRMVFQELLEGLGFEVVVASGGSEAVAMLPRLAALDMVITDQYMPYVDGWQVLEHVHVMHPGVPVIMISAAPSSPPLDWNPQLRFSAQFLRPVDHAQLLARMGDLLDLQWADVTTEPVAAQPLAQQSQPPSGAATALGLLRPGARDLQALAQMVELGQVTAIEEWCRRLQAERADYLPFVEEVLQAVHCLDFPALLQLAASVGEGGSSPDRPT